MTKILQYKITHRKKDNYYEQKKLYSDTSLLSEISLFEKN